MKILLLGATGMLGTSFRNQFDTRNIAYVPVDHAALDIESEESVSQIFSDNPADVVINCVGIVSINPCEDDPEHCMKVNALGALYVSREATARGMTMVQFSSHAVFDGNKHDYYTEDDIPKPQGVYAVSKYASEVFASLCPKHYVCRVPVMFGPRQNTSLGFVDKMIQLLESGKELRVASDKIDSPTYSIDVAKTVVDMLLKNQVHGLYHIANDGVVNYHDLVIAVRDMLGIKAIIVPAKDSDFPSRVPKPLRTAMRSTKLPTLRGWREALTEYLLSRP